VAFYATGPSLPAVLFCLVGGTPFELIFSFPFSPPFFLFCCFLQVPFFFVCYLDSPSEPFFLCSRLHNPQPTPKPPRWFLVPLFHGLSLLNLLRQNRCCIDATAPAALPSPLPNDRRPRGLGPGRCARSFFVITKVPFLGLRCEMCSPQALLSLSWAASARRGGFSFPLDVPLYFVDEPGSAFATALKS